MKFCMPHWNAMRSKVESLGLSHLVAQGGSPAMAQLLGELSAADPVTIFNPLMSMHWAILSNILELLTGIKAPTLYLFNDGPEDPVDKAQAPDSSRDTWPRCPLCYINLAHEITCRDLTCTHPKLTGFNWMIDQAGSDALSEAEALGLLKES